MKEHYKNYNSRKGENVIVTGLPKWDYPLKLNSKNTPMPEQWKNKLKGRKVFLWNTHFSLDMGASQVFTPKAAEFLDIFSKNPNIALIWRPHPLTDTVLNVYFSPQTIQMYKNLVKTVENSDNMVIDKFAAYDAAFVYSDALISDYSSLIDQYMLMNKPALFLTKNDIETEKNNLCDGSELFDYSKMLFANTIEMQKQFIDDVCKGDISRKNQQEHIIKNFFVLADGKCGQRTAEKVIEDFKAEVLMPPRKTDVLIIGSLESSSVCIETFTANNTDFYICDMFLNMEQQLYYVSFSLEEISQFDYKCIVITEENSESLKELLISKYNADSNKIIEYHRMHNACIPNMLADKVMMNPEYQSYDGMILGLSRAKAGIITDRLNNTFCNISVPHQDFYYQLQTLKYCLYKYPDKIKKLKYAVIDLGDYDYFNFDTSLSESAAEYFTLGGYDKAPHNFDNNPNFNYTFKQLTSVTEAKKYANITDEHIKIWDDLFSDVFMYENYKSLKNTFNRDERLKTVSDDEIDSWDYNRPTVTQINNNTITENISLLFEIMNTFNSINHNIEIYTIVIPKYTETEKRDYEKLSIQKTIFDKIIISLKRTNYQIKHIDFKEISDISYHTTKNIIMMLHISTRSVHMNSQKCSIKSYQKNRRFVRFFKVDKPFDLSAVNRFFYLTSFIQPNLSSIFPY